VNSRGRVLTTVGAVVAQLAIVVIAVAPQLSARALGSDVTLRVAGLDQVVDRRDAYVELAYPDLPSSDPGDVDFEGVAPGEPGTVFVPLAGEGYVWVGGEPTRTRPGQGTYLRCDDSAGRVRCGIETLYLSVDGDPDLRDALGSGRALATVKVDGRGNAALVDVYVP
jgi:hypothetical protein